MRIIMVPVADRPECGIALGSAFDLADRLQANIHACHIRPHRYSRVLLPAEASYLLPEDRQPELDVSDRKSAAEASKAARALVEEVAAARGFTMKKSLSGKSVREIVWIEEVGHVENLMPVIGPFADLIVVSRPKRAMSHVARLFLNEALLNSSRPVLIVPPNRRVKVGRRIVIGWDRTRNAMRAVVAALPILHAAEDVSIITSGGGKEHGAKASHLVRYLKAWGIRAEAKRTPDRGGSEIDDIDAHCQDRGADLLVIGSYSRSRFRERLFGGVTQHYLFKSKLSVLSVNA